MMNKINRFIPVWFYAGVFCLLMPEISIGTVADTAQNTPLVVSEQLKHKMELLDQHKQGCQSEGFCLTGKIADPDVDVSRTGMVMLLASLTVRR
ncbi:MAG: hypothetical protein PVG66_08555 [Chromatiales bacterium]|jgi:hypothetical protein